MPNGRGRSAYIPMWRRMGTHAERLERPRRLQRPPPRAAGSRVVLRKLSGRDRRREQRRQQCDDKRDLAIGLTVGGAIFSALLGANALAVSTNSHPVYFAD